MVKNMAVPARQPYLADHLRREDRGIFPGMNRRWPTWKASGNPWPTFLDGKSMKIRGLLDDFLI